MRALLVVLAVLSTSARAAVFIEVREAKTNKVTVTSVDAESERAREVPSSGGSPLPATNAFAISDRGLIYQGRRVSKAEEVLYQCSTDGFDIAVVREEYNSFSNPLRILAAFSGHPIQVSKVKVVTAKGGGRIWEHVLASEPASYHWSAKVAQ